MRSQFTAVLRSELVLALRRRSTPWVALSSVGIGILTFSRFLRVTAGDLSETDAVAIARNSTMGLSVVAVAYGLLLAPYISAIAAEAATRDRTVGFSPLLRVRPITARTVVFAKWLSVCICAVLWPLVMATTWVLVQPRTFGDVPMQPAAVVPALMATLEFAVPQAVWIATLAFALALASGRPLFAYATVPVQWMSTLLIITAVQRSELRWMWVLDPAGIAALAEIGRSASSNADLNAQMWLGGAAYAWNRLVLILASATVAALAVFVADGRLGGVTIANLTVLSRQRRRRPGARPSVDASASLSPANAPAQRWSARRYLSMTPFAAALAAELRLMAGEKIWIWFLPLLTLLLWRTSDVAVGPFNAEELALTYNTVRQSLWLCCVAVTAVVTASAIESVFRDRDLMIAPLLQTRSGGFVRSMWAKWAAHVLLAAGLLGIASFAAVAYQFWHGITTVRASPIIELYGLIVLPTAAMCASFGIGLSVWSGQRQSTYVVLAGICAVYAWAISTGHRHWAINLPTFGLWSYSDIAGFGPLRRDILVHRLFVMALSLTLVATAAWRGARGIVRGPGAGKSAMATAMGLVLVTLVLWSAVVARTLRSAGSSEDQRVRAGYEATALPILSAHQPPRVVAVELEVDLYPMRQRVSISGRYTLEHRGVGDVYVTVNPRLLSRGRLTINGRPPTSIHDALVTFSSAFLQDKVSTLEFSWTASVPDGLPARGGRLPAFVDRSAALLTSTYPFAWLPVVGYSLETELGEESVRTAFGLGARRFPAFAGDDTGLYNHGSPFAFSARVRAPRDFAIVASGRAVAVRDRGETVEHEFATAEPALFFAIAGGHWQKHSDRGVDVYFSQGHAFNVRNIAQTAADARDLFTTMFGPIRLDTLSIVEIPQVGTFAGMAFPGLMPLSEDTAFLTRDTTRRSNVNTFVIAHEVAHQWWGNRVWPAHEPGAFILTEGMATYAALAFLEELHGEAKRAALFEDLEYQYLRNRRLNEEQPLIKVDGTRIGDVSVMYQRAGIVLSMLERVLGRDVWRAELARLYSAHTRGRHPSAAAFIERLASLSDRSAQFIDQYIYGSALPDARIADAVVAPDGANWSLLVEVENRGTGNLETQLRVSGDEGEVLLLPVNVLGMAQGALRTRVPFRPTRLTIDPERQVILRQRATTDYRF